MVTDGSLLVPSACQRGYRSHRRGRTTLDRPGDGWWVVLRRQPARIVAGQFDEARHDQQDGDQHGRSGIPPGGHACLYGLWATEM